MSKCGAPSSTAPYLLMAEARVVQLLQTDSSQPITRSRACMLTTLVSVGKRGSERMGFLFVDSSLPKNRSHQETA